MQKCYSNYKQVKSEIKCTDCKDIEGCIRDTKIKVKASMPKAESLQLFCNCCMRLTKKEELKYKGEQWFVNEKTGETKVLYLYNHKCDGINTEKQSTLASKTKLNLG